MTTEADRLTEPEESLDNLLLTAVFVKLYDFLFMPQWHISNTTELQLWVIESNVWPRVCQSHFTAYSN